MAKMISDPKIFFNDRLAKKRRRMVNVTLCCLNRRIFIFEFLIVSHCRQL